MAESSALLPKKLSLMSGKYNWGAISSFENRCERAPCANEAIPASLFPC
jgi:hypothetical protein